LKIVLNGTTRDVKESMTVSSLLQELGIHAERVAVEINLQIIERTDFKITPLKEGDQIELIGFVGGGTSIHEWQ
jgi:sulfur carrier protein